MKRYQWKEGSRAPRGIAADEAGVELERIRNECGSLTGKTIVDESRPEDAVLHRAFEWDDEKAAEAHRMHQARTLIRSIVVVHDEREAKAPQHRAYALVTKADEPKKAEYVPSEIIAQRVDLFADAVGRLESKMREIGQSIRDLESLAKRESADPERMARISMAAKALETASAAIAGLH